MQAEYFKDSGFGCYIRYPDGCLLFSILLVCLCTRWSNLNPSLQMDWGTLYLRQPIKTSSLKAGLWKFFFPLFTEKKKKLIFSKIILSEAPSDNCQLRSGNLRKILPRGVLVKNAEKTNGESMSVPGFLWISRREITGHEKFRSRSAESPSRGNTILEI